jgi:cytochrome c biogenesis protein CcdA
MTKILEIIFIFAAGLAMPFIVIGSYFNLVPSEQRSKPLSIFFLIISVIYALAYAYFSWKALSSSDN